MTLEGTYELKALPDRVWEALNDSGVLAQCTPGCKQMVLASDGSYDVLLEVGVAGIKGRYTGKITITDRVPGSQFRMTVTGNGSTGFIRAEGVIQLKGLDGRTVIEYSGQVQVGGPIAGVGQRVMGGVSKLMVRQFFQALEKAVVKTEDSPKATGDIS